MLTDEREALVELLEARARSEDGRILDRAKETRSFVVSTGPRPRRRTHSRVQRRHGDRADGDELPGERAGSGSAVALAVQDVAKALRPRSSANPACCVSSSWKRAGLGESIPLACQDWAGTKAAYRFFSNERVSEEEILRGHFDATRHRFAVSDGPILVLHDTTEFSWRRKRPEAVGFPSPTAWAQ